MPAIFFKAAMHYARRGTSPPSPASQLLLWPVAPPVVHGSYSQRLKAALLWRLEFAQLELDRIQPLTKPDMYMCHIAGYEMGAGASLGKVIYVPGGVRGV
jgi:hypothetical protein